MRIDIKKLYSRQLKKVMQLRIYVPKGYNPKGENEYPVIYMQEGQNLFNFTFSKNASWRMNEVLNELDKKVIIVGIDYCTNSSTSRDNEYSPWKARRNLRDVQLEEDENRGANGKGDEYSRFIVESLIPFVEKNYKVKRTKEARYIAGSSMGAFISIYTGLKYKDHFNGIGALSTSLWYNEDSLLKHISNEEFEGGKVFLYVGKQESGKKSGLYLDGAHKLNDSFEKKDNVEVKFVVNEEGRHNPMYWSEQIPYMLDFFKI